MADSQSMSLLDSVDFPSPGLAMISTDGLAMRLARNQDTWSKQITARDVWCRPMGAPSRGSWPGEDHGNSPHTWRVVPRHSSGTGTNAVDPPPGAAIPFLNTNVR